MTYYLRTVGKQADLIRFPPQSAAEPTEPIAPDPRDKRPVEIERISDDDRMLPAKDEHTGDKKPRTPPPPLHDQPIFS